MEALNKSTTFTFYHHYWLITHKVTHSGDVCCLYDAAHQSHDDEAGFLCWHLSHSNGAVASAAADDGVDDDNLN